LRLYAEVRRRRLDEDEGQDRWSNTTSSCYALTFRYNIKRNGKTGVPLLKPKEVGGAAYRRSTEWRWGKPRGDDYIRCLLVRGRERNDNQACEIGPGP
jgi:hypothetical protein